MSLLVSQHKWFDYKKKNSLNLLQSLFDHALDAHIDQHSSQPHFSSGTDAFLLGTESHIAIEGFRFLRHHGARSAFDGGLHASGHPLRPITNIMKHHGSVQLQKTRAQSFHKE
jgi:hypothetical protein